MTYTAVSALAVKIFFAVSFYFSYFESYHLVPGLDMQTLLRYSEWLGENSYPSFFTFHRLVIFLVWLLNGKNHCVWAIFIIQSLIGIAGAVCMADTVRKLSGSRKTALICGIASGIYLPSLVYEFSVLKETFAVNFSLFLFWSMLHALHRKFDWKSSLLFGFCCFAALEGRVAILPYVGICGIYCIYKMWKYRKAKRVFLCALFPALLLLTASAFNKVCGSWQFSPFFNIVSYTIEYNAAAPPPATADLPATPTAASKLQNIRQTIVNAASRVPTLFKHGELPENQNIYFWSEKIPQYKLLIGPGLLIPCAAMGIMIIIFSGAWKKRYGLLLLPVITLMLPLCAREPIGRYRLMLVPYFFMISCCAVLIFSKLQSPKRRGFALLGAGIGAFFSIHNGEVPQRIRYSDYRSYAIAVANTPEVSKEEILSAVYEYWEATGFRSSAAFEMMMGKALSVGELQLASSVITQAAANGIDINIIRYFNAWIYALQNRPIKVKEELEKIHTLPRELQQKAARLYYDTIRILNNTKK